MIVLGDNPFFGVNHASALKAREYLQRMHGNDWSAVHATMRAALSSGISSFMVSTHKEAPDLLRSMAEDRDLHSFSIIPAVPYLHRLNSLVASRGIAGAAVQSLSYSAFAGAFLSTGSLTAAGLFAFIAKEIEPIRKLGFNIQAVALQNIFVDLLIGLGLADLINAVAEKGSRDGWKLIAITMNPLLADSLLHRSITICTHYNYLGYLVQPNVDDLQRWVSTTERETWAMGVLSSGRAQLENVVADRYLRCFKAVVVGASRPASISKFAAAYAAH